MNQYLGGGTIFTKAKRSLTNSFDQLLKRKTSKDDFSGSLKGLNLPIHGNLNRVRILFFFSTFQIRSKTVKHYRSLLPVFMIFLIENQKVRDPGLQQLVHRVILKNSISQLMIIIVKVLLHRKKALAVLKRGPNRQ